MSVQCPNCHNENAEDARFCTACARRLLVTCASCSTVNRVGSRFCTGCGRPLEGEVAAPAEPVLPEPAARSSKPTTRAPQTKEPEKKTGLPMKLIGGIVTSLIIAGLVAGFTNVLDWLGLSRSATDNITRNPVRSVPLRPLGAFLTPTPDTGGLATDPTAGKVEFEVVPPPGWVVDLEAGRSLVGLVDPSAIAGLAYFAGLPDGEGGYAPTIMVFRQALLPGEDLEVIVEAEIEALGVDVPLSDVVSSAQQVDGLAAARLVITDPPDAEFPDGFVSVQYLVARGEALWVLQCAGLPPETSRRHQDEWEACGDALDAFRFAPG